MVYCDVSTANGELRRWEVGVPKGVVGLILDAGSGRCLTLGRISRLLE